MDILVVFVVYAVFSVLTGLFMGYLQGSVLAGVLTAILWFPALVVSILEWLKEKLL